MNNRPTTTLESRITNFYNTVNLEGQDLIEAIKQARNQGEIVYAFFKANPNGKFTPFNVWAQLLSLRPDMVNELTPITSIRRSMCDLTHAGLLVKTDEKRKERLGMVNYLWKLKVVEKMPIQGELF